MITLFEKPYGPCVFGLIRLGGNIYGAEYNDLAPVELVIDQGKYQSKLSWAPSSLKNTQTFYGALITPLLDNGPHQLHYCLKNTSGEKIWSATQEIQVDNESYLASCVRTSLKGRSPIHSGLVHASDFDGCKINPMWFDGINAINEVQERVLKHGLDQKYIEPIQTFIRDGVLSIEHFFADDEIDNVNESIGNFINSSSMLYKWGSGDRLNGLHLELPAIRKLWWNSNLLKLLNCLFDCPADPSQSLVFIHGSQQAAHQDTFVLTSYPLGAMLGAWIALEDIHPDSGPLEYYPGSHRMDPILNTTANLDQYPSDQKEYDAVYEAHLLERLKIGRFERKLHIPKKGDLLLWHTNLAHGGSKRNDPEQTRFSIVFHYFARGSLSYAERSGVVLPLFPQMAVS